MLRISWYFSWIVSLVRGYRCCGETYCFSLRVHTRLNRRAESYSRFYFCFRRLHLDGAGSSVNSVRLFHPPGAAVRPHIQIGECPKLSQLRSVLVNVSVLKESVKLCKSLRKNSMKIKVSAFWDVTAWRLAITNLSEELNLSIFRVFVLPCSEPGAPDFP